MKRILLISLLTWVPFALLAQNYSIQLESETFLPEERSLSQVKWKGAEVVGGNYYRYIQFRSIPTQAQKDQLIAKGIKLYNYIPNNTFMASIPATLDLSTIEDANIRSVFAIRDRNKFSKDLLHGKYPEWALRGNGTIEVTVMHHPDLTAIQVSEYLRAEGIEIVHSLGQIHAHRIVLKIADLGRIAGLPFIWFIEPVDPVAHPDNLVGRTDHRSNTLATDYGPGLKYDGTGVAIALNDDGVIGPHVDYEGRVIGQYTSSNNGDHGDHCAGTIFGAGNKDPKTKGMAFGATLGVYRVSGSFPSGYQGFDSIYNHYNTKGIRITSTSYSDGNSTGYTTRARLMDMQMNSMPELMHVFSAGNAGTSNYNYGAGAGWGNVTGGHKQAKNVIAVANLSYLDVLSSSSSRGPAKDGRIKPDISAVGSSVYSTSASSTVFNNYVTKSGTSMSCPGVSGTIAQLYHAYKTLNNGDNPPAALIKAIVLNSADDIGNPGPDYKHGWGRINARRAYNLIESNSFLVDSLTHGVGKAHSLSVPAGVSEMRVMVYWQDKEATAGVAKALVNNLDMTVSTPALQTVYPLVLDRTPTVAALDANAVPGVDTLNNMEQVVITNPATGSYSINVAGFSVPQGPQKYYVVFEFITDEVVLTYPIGGESFVPGVTETIRWDAYGSAGTFTLQYSTNNGGSWTNISTGITGTQRYFNWAPPSTVTGKALIRITRGAMSDQSEAPFTIIGVPSGLTVNWVCVDSMMVSYNSVSGAAGYIVTVLGSQFMDSVAFSNTTSCVVRNINTLVSGWVSVQAMTSDSGKGRRAIAAERPVMPFNCTVPNDNAIVEYVSPSVTDIINCQATPLSQTVTIKVKNNGLNLMSNITAKYTVNGGTPVTDIIPGPIVPQNTLNHTFSQPVFFSTAGTHVIKAWIEHSMDSTYTNDTLVLQKTVINPPLETLPFAEDFELFTLCDTSANCEADVCQLSAGWINEVSSLTDDIDWRINAGPTPDATTSGTTGPTMDYNPGTAAGHYAYLEATGCYAKRANLISPCIDLTSFGTAQFSFAYHMFGSGIGSLHVDVLTNGQWVNDVMPAISGDQGNNWVVASAVLTPYAGQVINVRLRGITGATDEGDIAIDDIKISGTLGINETSKEISVQVFPNPSEGIFNLTISRADSQVDIVVTDVNGKVIEQSIVNPSAGSIATKVDLRKAASGVYFLSVRSGGEVINRKLTKF